MAGLGGKLFRFIQRLPMTLEQQMSSRRASPKLGRSSHLSRDRDLRWTMLVRGDSGASTCESWTQAKVQLAMAINEA